MPKKKASAKAKKKASKKKATKKKASKKSTTPQRLMFAAPVKGHDLLTREGWMGALAERVLVPRLAAAGFPVTAPFRISCGWGAGTRFGSKVRGQIHSMEASADRTHEIFISPNLHEAHDAGRTLLHELVHAAVGLPEGHGKTFKAACAAVGIVGKIGEQTATDELIATFTAFVKEHGKYPHARLDLGGPNGPKKQGTRMLKCECSGCGFVVRTTQKWLDVAIPECPNEACEEHRQPLAVG